MKDNASKATSKRPPVVVVMGHIDHGKSTLLDYIRKSNVSEKEAGGITQHISAYEVIVPRPEGKSERITFLDTPGHEAFRAMRERGANVADIAILVISAEDGVKPQTLEALRAIREAKMPFVVALNKIDKQGADVEKVKQNLAENDVFVEGYGGNVPWAAISAKTGAGVEELLDLILLMADIENFTGDASRQAEAIIIESHLDAKKGISTVAIIKDGTMRKGEFVVSSGCVAPLRIVENFLGEPISEISFSSPVRITGWDKSPSVGSRLQSVKTKKEALEIAGSYTETPPSAPQRQEEENDMIFIPIVIKADTSGSLDALTHEINKLGNERARPKIIIAGVGPVSEGDIKSAQTKSDTLIISFNTKIDPKTSSLAERLNQKINHFDIIYKLTEWLEGEVAARMPSVMAEETVATAKILKTFSKNKDKQIVGGKVTTGALPLGADVRIMRHDAEIARGRVRELQQSKVKAREVQEGNEFGAMIESRFEIMPGDKIEAMILVKT